MRPIEVRHNFPFPHIHGLRHNIYGEKKVNDYAKYMKDYMNKIIKAQARTDRPRTAASACTDR